MMTGLRHAAGRLVLISAVALVAAPARAQDAGSAEAGKIVGIWLNQLTAYDCHSVRPEPPRARFDSRCGPPRAPPVAQRQDISIRIMRTG